MQTRKVFWDSLLIKVKAFIQTLLSTAVSPQRFSFFTVYLGATYMRKIIPPGWDVSPEWDLGGMVCFTL